MKEFIHITHPQSMFYHTVGIDEQLLKYWGISEEQYLSNIEDAKKMYFKKMKKYIKTHNESKINENIVKLLIN